jgi:hypothetical protein
MAAVSRFVAKASPLNGDWDRKVRKADVRPAARWLFRRRSAPISGASFELYRAQLDHLVTRDNANEDNGEPPHRIPVSPSVWAPSTAVNVDQLAPSLGQFRRRSLPFAWLG